MKLSIQKLAYASMLALGLSFLAGCGLKAPVVPPFGTGFNSTSFPLETTYEQNPIGSKQGTASTVAILGLFSFGDGSIQTAARDANISTIRHVDSELTNILGIYVEYKMIVYGD